MRNTWWAKTLRILGIVLMSLTAAFTLLGGAGTSCVAFNPTGYGPMFASIASYQWLWILFVVIGVVVGALGIRAVVLLVRGASQAYRYALTLLIIGSILNLIHMLASRALRGSSMPVDAVFYANLLTLIVFLLFRLPGIWQGVNYEKPPEEKETGRQAASMAMAVTGVLTLTIQYLMAPTHTINGINYADVWHTTLTIIGAALLAGSVVVAIRTERAAQRAASTTTTA